MQKPSLFRFLTTAFMATLLTVFTVIFGTPLLRVMRNVFGPLKYWLFGLFVGATFWLLHFEPVALYIMSFWLVVGIYGEIEERGHASFWAAVGATLVSSVFLLGGLWFWVRSLGVDAQVVMAEALENLMRQWSINKSSPEAAMLDPQTILHQMPSAIVVLEMMALGFALMLDRKTGILFGLRFERIATHMRLLEFKIPDFFIWITMFSFLLSFTKFLPDYAGVIATNIFYVMMGLYFFQGLAVLEVLFLVYRINSFIKFLIYFFIVGQLFFLLSLVGLIDYWADFRSRIRRMRRPEGSQKNGEHI